MCDGVLRGLCVMCNDVRFVCVHIVLLFQSIVCVHWCCVLVCTQWLRRCCECALFVFCYDRTIFDLVLIGLVWCYCVDLWCCAAVHVCVAFRVAMLRGLLFI